MTIAKSAITLDCLTYLVLGLNFVEEKHLSLLPICATFRYCIVDVPPCGIGKAFGKILVEPPFAQFSLKLTFTKVEDC